MKEKFDVEKNTELCRQITKKLMPKIKKAAAKVIKDLNKKLSKSEKLQKEFSSNSF